MRYYQPSSHPFMLRALCVSRWAALVREYCEANGVSRWRAAWLLWRGEKSKTVRALVAMDALAQAGGDVRFC